MLYLLDINVLIALMDPTHEFHQLASGWFVANRSSGQWATCPLTESGVLRIMGNSKYRNSPGNPAVVAEMLRILMDNQTHVFLHDTGSPLDRQFMDSDKLTTSAQVTDSYLLALSAAHNAKLATFDRRLISLAVESGQDSLHIIG